MLTSKITIYIVIFLLVKICSLNVLAEENKQNEADKNSQISSTQKSETIKPNIGKRSRIKTLEEFIPSEEVSADKPIAFPADI